jgi:hypothetical protein
MVGFHGEEEKWSKMRTPKAFALSSFSFIKSKH